MEKDLLADLERDAENTAKAIPDEDKLKRISSLAVKQVMLENEITRLTDELAERNKELEEIRDRVLSDLLIECGLTEIKLVNGKKVKVDKMVFASIKGDARKAAIEWLEANKFGALVKYKVEADVGKGQTETYKKILDTLFAFGIEVKEKADVHPQTLRAFVAEQLSAGADLPQELFGVHIINRCKIA